MQTVGTKRSCLTKPPDRAAWPGPSSGDTPYLGPAVLRGCQSQGTPSCPSSSIPTTAVIGLWMSQIRPIRVWLGLFWYTQVGNTSFRFGGHSAGWKAQDPSFLPREDRLVYYGDEKNDKRERRKSKKMLQRKFRWQL